MTRIEAADLPVVVVAVMDGDHWRANTDNLAIVDPVRRRVLSIPRDLWSPSIANRINRAWAEGQAPVLLRALAEHGFEAQAAICLCRSAVSRALTSVVVTVPVDQPMTFLYPKAPEERIEDGAVVVQFDPPSETLEGVRIHQWLGARRVPFGDGSDLLRVPRQQTLVRQLIGDGFDFRRMLIDPDLVRVTEPAALETLACVGADWTFEVLDNVLPRRIDGKDVLVRRTTRGVARSLALRLARRARSVAVGRLSRVPLPTGGWREPKRRIRLVAIIAVRDEERFLPGWLANVSPHVDGVIALDDGSSDRSAEILAAHPDVLTVITRPRDRESWDEVDNHRRLMAAAVDHGATWIIALDADERVERSFRTRVERTVRRGRWLKLEAFETRMRELWNSPTTWRADGIWGRKRPARLFACRADHVFSINPLHASKAPEQAKRWGVYPLTDVRVYHLRMIEPADRTARRDRYERLDPERTWQARGYAYLTDDTGIKLRKVRPRRAAAPH